MYFSRVLKVVLLLSLLALVFPMSAVYGGVSVGSAVIRDSSPGLSDMLVVELTNVAVLSDGDVYEGWLVTDDSSVKLSVGVIAIDEDGNVSHSFTHADGVNLASIYDKFEMSVEPANDTDSNSSGVISFSDMIPAAGMAHIRHLIYSASGNPTYTSGPHEGVAKGINAGMLEQIDVALTEAALSLDATNLDNIKLHAGQVINIIEGTEGANFDISHGNPGDGIGVLNYAADARKHAEFTLEAVPSDANVAKFSSQVSESSDNVANWAGMARDMAVTALNSSTTTAAKAFMTNSQTLLGRALNGWDADRDGTVETIPGEAGATHAQIAAQNMGTYNPVVPPAPPPTPLPPATGDINFSVFALIALAAGAVLVVGGGVFLRNSRART